MGRWIVIIGFVLFSCGLVYHFWPATSGVAFDIKGHAIPWMMLIGIGGLYVGHRLTGK